MKLIDLAWVTGKLGQPGCGVNTVTEEPNEQGAVDMGAAPEFLPGQASFNDQTARDRFAKAWDVTLPAAGSGANLVEILKRCRSGQIRALYVIGENPLATLPASMEVRAALDRLELLVVQDPFLTDTARMAHAVLPACTSAEKDGTFTNLEGRVLRVREAIDPIGESLPDWHIMTALANALGCQWAYESSNDIQAEIMKLLPGYYNLGQPRKGCADGGPLSLQRLHHRCGGALSSLCSSRLQEPATLCVADGTGLVSFRQAVHRSFRAHHDRPQYRAAQDESPRYGTARSG